MRRRVFTFSVVVVLFVSIQVLIIPINAQSEHPVEVWPTMAWATSDPETQGMDSTALGAVYDYVESSGADVRSLLVVRHGYIVAEEYFTPQLYDVNNTHILFSVTKSFVSCLIGIAIDLDFIDNTSQLLLDFFPEKTIANMSAWKEDITLEDVLMMRSGFQWDEDNYDEYNDFFAMRDSGDWVQYVLDRPMAYEPGSTFYYNSGNSHLLAAIINVTTGRTPLSFADQYLFEPLGISHRAWTTDPQGINFGGSNLALRARDMAKLGLLYLNNGSWDDQQIVSSEWVERSSNGPSTPYTHVSYGYQWWIDDNHNWYSARGYNGQFIYVINEYDMAVVFSSDVEDYFPYDATVSDIVDAVTNIYPEGEPFVIGPIEGMILVGVVVIAAVAVVVRLKR
jgi:CubicO group peptidase (beta-lactamase class C family)